MSAQPSSVSRGVRTKLVVAGLGVALVFSWFFFKVVNSGVGAMQYYHTLGEFRDALDSGVAEAATTGLRLNGFVKDGSIQRDTSRMTIDFVMNDGGPRELPVHLARLDVSDLFKDGANVVVEGHLGEDGIFYADQLFAKCPTKYEAAEGAPQASL